LAKAKKQVSCSAPTDRMIGQSARPGQARRFRAATRTKAVAAERVARAAASQTGVLASEADP
jgi:hypothetical protein